MNDPWDDFTFVTFEVHKLRHTHSNRIGVLYTGMSMTREAIYDDHLLEGQLLEASGVAVDFYNTATSWQSLWETVAIVDQLPPTFRGVVIVGIAPSRIARSREWLARLLEYPQLAITSEAFNQEVRNAGFEPPKRTGVYVIDHARFFAARRKWALRLLSGPLIYQRHRYTNQRPWSEKHWQEAQDRVVDWMQGADENGEANLAILSRAVKRLQARGIRVVLSESSLNPRAAVMCGPRYEMYSARMTTFSKEHNVPYWNTNRDAKLTAADFHDWVHVADPAAQQRHQQALVTGLRPILIELNEGPDV